jgi:hypothetical protein
MLGFVSHKECKIVKRDTQMDYKILRRSDIHNLETDVAEWTQAGYHLIGGIVVYLDNRSNPVFVQAVAVELE